MDEIVDFEEAVISINSDKKITRDFGLDIVLDLSEEEFENELLMHPVHMINEYEDWRRKSINREQGIMKLILLND